MNSPIDIAEYRVPVEYQTRTLSKDRAGGVVETWTTQWSGRACIRPLSARELFYAGGTSAQATHRVFLRYRPGVTSEGRFKLADGRFLDLSSVLDLEERQQVLDCQAIETQGG